MTIKKLPSLKSKEVIRVLERLGFQKDRQKGSHLIMFNNFTKRRTTVPVHKGKDIKKSLLKGIIEEDVGITIEEFFIYYYEFNFLWGNGECDRIQAFTASWRF